MSERTYYCMCEDKCLFETMTKEQILSAITQAVESHTISDVDTGFVTKIKEKNGNKALEFWVGTSAEYNAIATKSANTFYILTDDTEKETMQTAITNLTTRVTALETPSKGVKLAESATGFSVGTTVHTATGIQNYKVLALEFSSAVDGITFIQHQTVLIFISGNSTLDGYGVSTHMTENEYDAYFTIKVQNDGFQLSSCGSTSTGCTVYVTAVYGVM